MLSSEVVEQVRAELRDMRSIVAADLLVATDRVQTIRGNQYLSSIQRVLDLLPET